MLWRHGVLPSNNARNSPLLGRGKFRFKCSFMCVKHCSDVLKSVMLSSLQNDGIRNKKKCIKLKIVPSITRFTHFEFNSFDCKSAAANALTTAFMAVSSGLLISSSSFCDIIFGFLPILFNLNGGNRKNGKINNQNSDLVMLVGHSPFGSNGFHSFSHKWILVQHTIEMVDT